MASLLHEDRMEPVQVVTVHLHQGIRKGSPPDQIHDVVQERDGPGRALPDALRERKSLFECEVGNPYSAFAQAPNQLPEEDLASLRFDVLKNDVRVDEIERACGAREFVVGTNQEDVG